MNKPTKRILLIVLLGALAIGLLALAFRPQPVLVEVAEVTRGHFEQTVEDDGKTRVRERYVVSAPLAGKLKRIELKAGDKVDRGVLLALIEPSIPALLDVRTERELTERLGAAEAGKQRSAAAVARAQATLDKSRADLARAHKLAASGFVSPTQVEQAELELKVNVRELEAAQFAEHAAGHDVETARAALLRAREGAAGKPSGRHWEVRSPVAGQVLKVIQESETTVAIGAPLLEIGDPADLEVVVDLLSTDAVQVMPGNAVRLERGGLAEPLEGRVHRVEPAAFTKISALGVEEQRVNVVIDLISPAGKWQSFGDGFRVDARIVVASLDNVITAPVSALFREGDQWAAFVVANGRTAKRIVQLVRRGELEAVIGKGLEPGEKVIVHPGDTVKDGYRVKMR
jgi:HlyD family secretion protein